MSRKSVWLKAKRAAAKAAGMSKVESVSSDGPTYTKEQIAQMKAEAEAGMKEMSKKGEMPLWGNIPLRDESARERLIILDELIDQYYAMPSEEYLAKVGLKPTSWEKKEIEGIGAVRSMLIEKEGTTGFRITVPFEASNSAMSGAIKRELYYELSSMRKLQKKQFSLSERRASAYAGLKKELDARISSGARADKVLIGSRLMKMYLEVGRDKVSEYLSSKGLSELQVISRATDNAVITRSWKNPDRVANYLLEDIRRTATKGDAFR